MQSAETVLNGKTYIIYRNGHIRNSYGHDMKPQIDKAGYCSLSIGDKRFLWHRVVAHAFLGTPLCGRDIQIHHKDENKSNNSVDNLFPLSIKEHQHLHKQKHPLTKKCIVCGKVFMPKPTKRARAKTCSKECWLVRTREQVKMREKPVMKIDPNTGRSEIFTSITKGVESIGKDKACCGNVLACINGRCKTAYGFVWRRA